MADEGSALETLMVLTEDLLKDETLERALERVTDAALELVGGDHASIRLLDGSGRQLLSGARSGVGKTTTAPITLRFGEGIAGWVLEHGERSLVEDVALDDRFVTHAGQGFAIRSVVCVPLFAPDMVVGVLGVSSSEGAAFDHGDLVLVQLLANCCAPSILRSRLRRLALTDHHTRALNQRAFLPRLQVEMRDANRAGRALALLLLDLDHFKRVNDVHGHAAGDAVLVEFAERVRGCIRAGDVFVRRGGEEFVLMLPGAGEEEAVAVAERIRAALAERAVELTPRIDLAQTVSIGVAIWDGHESPDGLDKRADRAMYAAKDAGRNRVLVDRIDPVEDAGEDA